MKPNFYNKIIFKILTIGFLAILFLPAATLAAEYNAADDIYGLNTTAGQAKIDTFDTKLSAETRLQTMIGQIINYIFGLMGVIFLTVVLIGGYKWMTAGGAEEKIGEAKKWVMNGVNGMIVMFLAYALVYVMLYALQGATG